MPKTTYFETAVLNLGLRGITFAAPSTIYVALYTVAPTVAGGGTEVSGGDYSRIAVTFAAPASGIVVNTADIVFPTASEPWGDVVAMALHDDPVAGHMLYFGSINFRQVQEGDVLKFPAGLLSVSES